jgi:hypothetical protein
MKPPKPLATARGHGTERLVPMPLQYTPCAHCGATIEHFPSQPRRFCGRSCRELYDRAQGVQIGQRFGRLLVTAEGAPYHRPDTGKPERQWICRCDCGTEKLLRSSDLRHRVKSCGCLHREVSGNRFRTHGRTNEPEYPIWQAIRFRCEDPGNVGYEIYGARGITVCAGWHDFGRFYDDMGARPSDKHSIDRVDNNGGYWCGRCEECVAQGRPMNCRWATVLVTVSSTFASAAAFPLRMR